jgi:hypothetical protein
MSYKHIALAFFLFIIGQILVWLQVNGPLLWTWAKEWRYALMLLGVPITWLFMEATAAVVTGFGGVFWPGRFISFTAGIIIFSIMTYMFKSEPITLKTLVSLSLAFGIIIIQLFWK